MILLLLLFFTEIDYLTSNNFLDMLDTGVLICHLARIIQEKARDILKQNSEQQSEDTTSSDNGLESSDNGSNDEKQAQQYLHAILRGANNNTTLIAAAKVSN